MSSSEIHGKQATAESDDADSTRATIGTPSGGRTAPDLDSHQSESARGNTAFTTERPLGVQPTPEGINHSIMAIKSDSQILAGGVAIGGQPNLPEGHAGFGDKVIGKTQKVIGKYTKNEELHEKGELRETGGKGAVLGDARAAHD